MKRVEYFTLSEEHICLLTLKKELGEHQADCAEFGIVFLVTLLIQAKL